jgi:hypothetical protein
LNAQLTEYQQQATAREMEVTQLRRELDGLKVRRAKGLESAVSAVLCIMACWWVI